MTDAELIEHLGGPASLAQRLRLPEKGGVQRVSNWKRRGIPAAMRLRYPELFGLLPPDAEQADAAANTAPQGA